jgi:hypothetical protein
MKTIIMKKIIRASLIAIFSLLLGGCSDIYDKKETIDLAVVQNSKNNKSLNISGRVASGPITVVTSAQFVAMGVDNLDAPLSTYVDGSGNRVWYHTEGWGEWYQRFSGTLDQPLQSVTWEKSRSQAFTNVGSIDGEPWIINVYKHADGVLAFLHIEHAGSGNKGRIALGWSSDNGNTFRWLGNIISAYGDPVMSNGFMEGCPYLVKDGYLYVYYRDAAEIGVSRAPLADVITAAKAGTVSPWKKYYNGAWNENGLGGNYSPLAAYGITHSAAFYSTYTSKYYLTTTSMTWNGVNTYIKLWESTDAVNWSLRETIAEKTAAEVGANTGYQYVSVVGTNGANNAVVGQQFYLYSGFKPYNSDRSILRWTVDLNGTGPTYYRLVNRQNPDKVLQLSGEPYPGYSNVYFAVGSPAGWNSYLQQWQLVDAGGGYTRLVNRQSPDKVLQLSGEAYPGYSNVFYTVCSPSGWNSYLQQWQIVDAGGGYKRLVNRQSPDKVLQLSGELYPGYSNVYYSVCSPGSWNGISQQWQLQQMP